MVNRHSLPCVQLIRLCPESRRNETASCTRMIQPSLLAYSVPNWYCLCTLVTVSYLSHCCVCICQKLPPHWFYLFSGLMPFMYISDYITFLCCIWTLYFSWHQLSWAMIFRSQTSFYIISRPLLSNTIQLYVDYYVQLSASVTIAAKSVNFTLCRCDCRRKGTWSCQLLDTPILSSFRSVQKQHRYIQHQLRCSRATCDMQPWRHVQSC